MKEVYRLAVEKHQRKHPGCSLNEKICKFGITDKCIEQGDISEFRKGRNICNQCDIVRLKRYYDDVLGEKRATTRQMNKKKRSRSVSFKKGTKKE